MIRYLTSREVDPDKWNGCLDACANDILFARPWFLDIVSPGWHALVEGDYDAVFPLAVRTKMNVAYAYQPYFTRYFGVFARQGVADAGRFLESLPARLRYIQCGLHESNRFTPPRGFTSRQRKYQALDLSLPYDELTHGYSVNVRRNLRKAEKAGFSVRTDVTPQVVVELFRQTKGGELSFYTQADYAMLHILMDRCVERGEGRSLGIADAGGRLVAAAFLMGSGRRFIYLKSGTTEAGRAGGAMHMLFDYFIQSRAGQGTTLDFGGSSVDSVARFYRGFGAADVVYLQVTGNRLPAPIRWLKK